MASFLLVAFKIIVKFNLLYVSLIMHDPKVIIISIYLSDSKVIYIIINLNPSLK